jgi:GNAT superfamily N-acetyltransferase
MYYFFSIESYNARKEDYEFPVLEGLTISKLERGDEDTWEKLLDCAEWDRQYEISFECVDRQNIEDRFFFLITGSSECWVVSDDEKIVGYTWVTRGFALLPSTESHIMLAPRDNTAYIEKTFVLPEWRRKKINTSLFRTITKTYPQTRFFGVVNSFAMPSIKCHLSMGFKRSGYFWYYRFISRIFKVKFEGYKIIRLESVKELWWTLVSKESIADPKKHIAEFFMRCVK